MNTKVVFLAVVSVAVSSAYPYPEGPIHGHPGGLSNLPRPGHDGSYGKDQYFQYINVPGPKEFEWGYRRGNPHHNREEYLSQKDHTFKAKVKWEDSYDGYGEHYYDINHGPSYHKDPYHEEPHKSTYHPEPVYKPGH